MGIEVKFRWRDQGVGGRESGRGVCRRFFQVVCLEGSRARLGDVGWRVRVDSWDVVSGYRRSELYFTLRGRRGFRRIGFIQQSQIRVFVFFSWLQGMYFFGGQKQRLSLVRVVYRKVVVYLLDDFLAVLDVYVGQYVFDQVIGFSGLFQGTVRLGKCVREYKVEIKKVFWFSFNLRLFYFIFREFGFFFCNSQFCCDNVI